MHFEVAGSKMRTLAIDLKGCSCMESQNLLESEASASTLSLRFLSRRLDRKYQGIRRVYSWNDPPRWQFVPVAS